MAIDRGTGPTSSGTTAATSAEQAAASAVAAAASAVAAANSETNADASADASAASAAAAASQASAASTSAGAAASSAAAAAASETAAAASDTAAAATYDAFDDRYLGSKSSAPTLDNDGNALLDGALYWDTTANKLYVYDLGAVTWKAIHLPPASDVSVTPAGNIASTDAQAALEELDAERHNFNYVINSNFEVAQRGTSEAMLAGGAYNYLADRWRSFNDASTITGTVSQQAFTYGQTDVPYEPQFFGRVLVSVAGASQTYHVLRQTIENVRHMAGRQVTLSFYAKGAASLTLPVINFIQTFGVGGSTAVTTAIASSYAITSSWAKYTITFTVPSISGKTINAGSYSILDFRLPIGVTFTFDMAQVKLELGAVATPNPPLPYGDELHRCQRYYHRHSGTGEYGAGVIYSTVLALFYWAYPTRMRTVPTIAFSSASHFSVVGGGAAFTPSTIAGGASRITDMSTRIDADITGATAGQGSVLECTSASGWMSAEAEL